MAKPLRAECGGSTSSMAKPLRAECGGRVPESTSTQFNGTATLFKGTNPLKTSGSLSHAGRFSGQGPQGLKRGEDMDRPGHIELTWTDPATLSWHDRPGHTELV